MLGSTPNLFLFHEASLHPNTKVGSLFFTSGCAWPDFLGRDMQRSMSMRSDSWARRNPVHPFQANMATLLGTVALAVDLQLNPYLGEDHNSPP